MSIAMNAENSTRNTSQVVLKTTFLLVISLGLFWFTVDYPFVSIFEPQSTGWVLWQSYANDLMQPLALYFFLCLGERWLKTWQVRALIALGIPMLLEFGQLLNGPFFIGRYIGAFDPVDFLMYAASVGLAVLLDQRVFKSIFRFW